MSDEQKPGLVYERIAKIMEEVPAIGKDMRNEAQRFNFRSIDQVYDVLHKLLAKYRLFFTPHVVGQERQVLDRFKDGKKVGHTVLTCLSVKYRIHCADDGSMMEVGPFPGEAADAGDKASAKAMSLAMKGALLQLFCIPIQAEGDFVPEDDEQAGGVQKFLDDKSEPKVPDAVARRLQILADRDCKKWQLSAADIASIKHAMKDAGATDPISALALLDNAKLELIDMGGEVGGVSLILPEPQGA